MSTGVRYLVQATDLAEKLRDALADEVERAQAMRDHFHALDSEALFGRAVERDEFHGRAQELQESITEQLRLAAESADLESCTTEALEAAYPGDAPRLSRILSEVSALAGALRELDQLNAYLGERALAIVQGYLSVLTPASTAYDRRAVALSSGPVGSTTSTRV